MAKAEPKVMALLEPVGTLYRFSFFSFIPSAPTFSE